MNKSPSELWKWEAVDLASAIRSRTLSSTEVVYSCLTRLEQVNPKLNAVVVVRPEAALAEARAADAAVSRGDLLGGLHGVPVTTKINVDQAGEATSHGVTALRDAIATEDSPVVSNLKAGGAILIGRTNCPAFAWNWFTDNELYGRTMNPWSADHSPGGSSGGAGASVASGITPIAHGNDIGGSIRYPAYCNGIVGLRPSFGRVPSYLPSRGNEPRLTKQLFEVQGPLARSVRDIRLALHVMSREDPRDPWWVPAPLLGPPLVKRVALSMDPGGTGVHPVVAESLLRAARLLADAGYLVEEAAPPDPGAPAREKAALSNYEWQHVTKPLIEKYGDESIRRRAFAQMKSHGPPASHTYIELIAQRTAWMRRWNLFLRNYPLWLCPVSFELPLRHEHDTDDPATINWAFRANLLMTGLPFLGVPAISIPTGVSQGLPTGVQLVGQRFREDILLDAAEVIEAGCTMGTPIDPMI